MCGHSRSRKNKIIFTLFIFPCLFASLTSAQNLSLNELMVQDLEKMKSIVKGYIDSSKDIAIKSQDAGIEKEKEKDVIFELKKALLVVLARPNRDYMSESLLPDVEGQLTNYDAYYSTLTSLNKEAIRVIKDDKLKPKIQSAFLYLIENTLSELRPGLKNDKKGQEVYKLIIDSKIKLSKRLKNFRYLEKMEDDKESPSKLAKKVYNEVLGIKKKPWYKFW